MIRATAAVVAMLAVLSVGGCGKSAQARLDDAYDYCHKESEEVGVALERHAGVIGATDVDTDPTDTFYARCMFRQLDTPQSVIDAMQDMPKPGDTYAIKHGGIYYLWELSGVNRSDVMFTEKIPDGFDYGNLYYKEA